MNQNETPTSKRNEIIVSTTSKNTAKADETTTVPSQKESGENVVALVDGDEVKSRLARLTTLLKKNKKALVAVGAAAAVTTAVLVKLRSSVEDETVDESAES